MTTTQSIPEIGSKVTFRPEAGGSRVGVEYILDSIKSIDAETGKQMVGLKRTVAGRTGYRLAYLCDLTEIKG